MSDLTVIRPGDTVLVSLSDRTSPHLSARLMADLQGRFPDCEFVVLGGVQSIDVYRPISPDKGD